MTPDVNEKTAPGSQLIVPGSLEWFRSRAPMPLLLEAMFEDPDYRLEFGHEDETADSAVESEKEVWDLLIGAEVLAENFEFHPEEPNAKEIARRLRVLTGCAGRLRRPE